MFVRLGTKLKDPAGVFAGGAAFGTNANGAEAVVLTGSAVFTGKLKGDWVRAVVLAASDFVAGAELEAAPN